MYTFSLLTFFCILCNFIPTSVSAQGFSDFKVTGFTLIDAHTDHPIPGYDPIVPHDTLNLNELPEHLNIRVNTTGKVESIQFTFTNPSRSRIENLAPYSLFGDENGNFNPGRLRKGLHTIKATPYSRNRASGEAGESHTISFTVTQEGERLEVTSLILVNSDTNEDLFELEDQSVLDLAVLPKNLNVRAEINGSAKSVAWSLKTRKKRYPTFKHIENASPFTLFGDSDSSYNKGSLAVGKHKLIATPFRVPNAQGTNRLPYSVRFTVIDSRNTAAEVSKQSRKKGLKSKTKSNA